CADRGRSADWRHTTIHERPRAAPTLHTWSWGPFVVPERSSAMLLSSDLTIRAELLRDAGTSAGGAHTENWQVVCTRWIHLRAATDERFAELRLKHPGIRWAAALRYDRDTLALRAGDRLRWISRDQVFVLQGPALDADQDRRELH